MLNLARDWHARFIAGTDEPRVDGDERTKAALQERWEPSGKMISAGWELEGMALALKRAKERHAKSERLVRLRENEIKMAIRHHEGAEGSWGRITWKLTKRGVRMFRANFTERED